MKKSLCQQHIEEEEKYFCFHPNCIKEQDNKLCCIDCFEQHLEGKTEFHKKTSFYQMLEKAKQKKEEFIKLQEVNVGRSELFFNNCRKELQLIGETIKKWQVSQEKLLENSSQRYLKTLQQEIQKAKEHYNESQLDSLIYFYLLDLATENQFSMDSQQDTERHINQLISDYQILANFLVKQNWDLQNVYQVNMGQFRLYKCDQVDIKIEKCVTHNEKKNQLQISQEMKKQDKFELSCLKCLMPNCQNQNIKCLNISDIIVQQAQKTQKFNDEFLKFKQKIQNYVNDQYASIALKQKERNDHFEQIKHSTFSLEKELLLKMQQQPENEYVVGNIDYNKLLLNNQKIESQFQQEYEKAVKIFQQNLEKLDNPDVVSQMKIQISNQQTRINELQLKIESEQKLQQQEINNKLQNIQNLEQKNQSCLQKLQKMEEKIKSQKEEMDSVLQKISNCMSCRSLLKQTPMIQNNNQNQYNQNYGSNQPDQRGKIRQEDMFKNQAQPQSNKAGNDFTKRGGYV